MICVLCYVVLWLYRKKKVILVKTIWLNIQLLKLQPRLNFERNSSSDFLLINQMKPCCLMLFPPVFDPECYCSVCLHSCPCALSGKLNQSSDSMSFVYVSPMVCWTYLWAWLG